MTRTPLAESILDPALHYALTPDLVVIERDAITVQIGTEAPRRQLAVDAPPGTASLLRALDGGAPLGAVVAPYGALTTWEPMLAELYARGMLVEFHARRVAPIVNSAERLALIHRYGVTGADHAMLARDDAMVQVDGRGALADQLAELLDGAGLGRIYRPRYAVGTVPVPAATGRAITYRAPASQVHPTLIAFADERGLPGDRAARLVRDLVPHLAVAVTATRAVVGPLVLPGRTPCLNCLDRQRSDVDPAWAAIADAMPPRAAPPLLIHAAAGIAAHEILEFIDGRHRPASVGATIEWSAGSVHPARRPWPMHAKCRCHPRAAKS